MGSQENPPDLWLNILEMRRKNAQIRSKMKSVPKTSPARSKKKLDPKVDPPDPAKLYRILLEAEIAWDEKYDWIEERKFDKHSYNLEEIDDLAENVFSAVMEMSMSFDDDHDVFESVGDRNRKVFDGFKKLKKIKSFPIPEFRFTGHHLQLKELDESILASKDKIKTFEQKKLQKSSGHRKYKFDMANSELIDKKESMKSENKIHEDDPRFKLSEAASAMLNKKKSFKEDLEITRSSLAQINYISVKNSFETKTDEVKTKPDDSEAPQWNGVKLTEHKPQEIYEIDTRSISFSLQMIK